MNNVHRKTLASVFTDPVSPNIRWADIEALLCAVDCVVIEGPGSRVQFRNGPLIASFHRPHPGKEAKRYQVRDAREFLLKIGIEP